MSRTYKAAIYHDDGDKGHIEIIEKALPDKCGDNDIIVKNLIAAICGADYLAYAHGNGSAHMLWSGYEFGHEMVSEVVEVGANVKDVSPGDWLFPNLGYAYHDHHRMATVGGFSEYLVLPDFTLEGSFAGREQPSAILLDKSLGLENLCLLEPISIGARAASSLNAEGKGAVVIGAGMIGIATALMLKYYGAKKVMIIDFSDFRLKNASQYGLLVCNPSKDDLKARLFEEFGKRPVYGGEKCCAEIFVDCIGIQACIDYFFQYAGYGATLCIVGTHHDPPTFDATSVCFNQQRIVGCGSAPVNKCFSDICDMIKKGTDVSHLITQSFPLDKIDEAMETHGNGNIAQKVVISYT